MELSDRLNRIVEELEFLKPEDDCECSICWPITRAIIRLKIALAEAEDAEHDD